MAAPISNELRKLAILTDQCGTTSVEPWVVFTKSRQSQMQSASHLVFSSSRWTVKELVVQFGDAVICDVDF